MGYRVIAAGQTVEDTTHSFVALTPRMSLTEAQNYLDWILKNGPKLKWLAEKELFQSSHVVNVVFTLAGE
jgi:hypothetical protein